MKASSALVTTKNPDENQHSATTEDLRQAASRLKVVYIIGTYPLSTTTFIDREIEVLRRLGVTVQVLSIRRPPHGDLALQSSVQPMVRYVLPVRPDALVWNHLRFSIMRPGPYFHTLFRLLSRPHSGAKSRLRTLLHFGLAVHTSQLLRKRYPCDHIHAHFVDRAALVALIAGQLLDKSFSATAHANDIYVDPVLIPEKVAQAKFIATCTKYNESYLRSMSSVSSARKLRCVYHGLDTTKYRPNRRSRKHPPVLLAVGQLKEKKGFGYLLEACRILIDQGAEFTCLIVGDGPLRSALDAKIAELSLHRWVRLLGSLPHEAVIENYREATIFVLPCVTAANGDRDGIPNVILEAMAMGLPVVSTRHSGIPEAVEDGRSGLLVTPADPAELAGSLARLIADEELRERLGRCGRERVVETFDSKINVTKLLVEFIA